MLSICCKWMKYAILIISKWSVIGSYPSSPSIDVLEDMHLIFSTALANWYWMDWSLVVVCLEAWEHISVACDKVGCTAVHHMVSPKCILCLVKVKWALMTHLMIWKCVIYKPNYSWHKLALCWRYMITFMYIIKVR